MQAAWPGQRIGQLPPGFPGRAPGGDIVFRRPRPAALKVADPPKPRPKKEAQPPKRRAPVRTPARFNSVVSAVYAALADPLAADSTEAREQRAARVRKAGSMAASAALVAVGIYGIFPVRTFLNQRQAESDTQERLDHLTDANRRLAEEAKRLKDKDEIELRARRDYGWVFPGEESYRVLPAPVAPTTTTTTAPQDNQDENDDSGD